MKRSAPFLLSRRLRRVAAFVLAASSGSLIALARLLMQDTLHGQAPFILAWPGMILAAFLGGFWPATIVTAVGGVVAQTVLIQNHLAPLRLGGFVVFGLFGLVFAVAGGLRQRGLRRAAENERRLAEMRLRLENITRLNAMGEMAGVLAHELNQPLTSIASYAGAARRLLGAGSAEPSELGELLARISQQSIRAGEVIARIRGYVARGEIRPSPQTLSVMFDEAAAVALAAAEGSSVAVRAEFGPGLGKVLADRIQVQQVMLNLIRNALEAMAGRSRRELRIGGALCGDMIEAYVADTGPGVSDEVAERLFQPFVTGKANGMGVGLSISRSIIEAHGGAIWVERNCDGGATFRFTLPLAGSATAVAA